MRCDPGHHHLMPIITELTKSADINPVHMGVVIIVTLGVRADHAAVRYPLP